MTEQTSKNHATAGQAIEAAGGPAPRGREEVLGVTVPLANEEDIVEELTARVLKHLLPQDRLFYTLDNVSTDGTRQKIEALSAADPRVMLVWAPQNRCVVDAYFAGYQAAYDYGCDWILEMDGGLSHPPELIPRFVGAMASGADFAAGSRFVKGGSYSGPFKRYLTSKGGSVLANLMLGTKLHDMCSGFECFSRRAMKHVLDRGVRSRRNFFQTEIRFMLRDWNWVEVPIHYRNPSKTLGASPVKEALRNLWWLRGQAKAERRRAKAERKAGRDTTEAAQQLSR